MRTATILLHHVKYRAAHAEISEIDDHTMETSELARVHFGRWGPCRASCGSGWQERPLLCSALPGYLAEAWQCSGADMQQAPTSSPCRCLHLLPGKTMPRCHADGSFRCSTLPRARGPHTSSCLEKGSFVMAENKAGASRARCSCQSVTMQYAPKVHVCRGLTGLSRNVRAGGIDARPASQHPGPSRSCR